MKVEKTEQDKSVEKGKRRVVQKRSERNKYGERGRGGRYDCDCKQWRLRLPSNAGPTKV